MLKYKALWVDDSTENRDMKIQIISEFLDEEGFVFEAIPKENADNIEVNLNDPDLDIIITDFNGVKIEELIGKVEGLSKYIDIVLYSEHPPTNFNEVARSYPGIYPCIRSDVVDVMKDVIRSTIRRTQSVNNMRGIVTSEAIDIETQIEAIILTYFDKEKDLAQKVLGYELCDFNKKIFFLNAILKKILRYLSQKSSDTTLDSNDRPTWERKRKEVHTLRDVCKRLSDEVMKPRNMLAHVGHKVDENGMHCLTSMKKGYEDIKIDLGWCKETRVRLAEHRENLDKVIEYIEDNTHDWGT